MPESLAPSVNLWFRFAAAATAVFVLTLFASIAALFSDEAGQNSPINRFLNEQAWTLMAVEVALIVGLGVIAMAVDGRGAVDAGAVKSEPAPPQPEPSPRPNDVQASPDRMDG